MFLDPCRCSLMPFFYLTLYLNFQHILLLVFCFRMIYFFNFRDLSLICASCKHDFLMILSSLHIHWVDNSLSWWLLFEGLACFSSVVCRPCLILIDCSDSHRAKVWSFLWTFSRAFDSSTWHPFHIYFFSCIATYHIIWLCRVISCSLLMSVGGKCSSSEFDFTIVECFLFLFMIFSCVHENSHFHFHSIFPRFWLLIYFHSVSFFLHRTNLIRRNNWIF